MIEHCTVRYRISTSKAKYRQMYAVAGACRLMWQHFAAQLQKKYQETSQCGFKHFTLCQQLTQFSKSPKASWLQDDASSIIRHSPQGIQTQGQNFFKTRVNQGLPKFKSKWYLPVSLPIGSCGRQHRIKFIGLGGSAGRGDGNMGGAGKRQNEQPVPVM